MHLKILSVSNPIMKSAVLIFSYKLIRKNLDLSMESHNCFMLKMYDTDEVICTGKISKKKQTCSYWLPTESIPSSIYYIAHRR